MVSKKNNLSQKKAGDGLNVEKGNWNFSGNKIAEKFYSHVSKSVPLYNEGHNLICELSEYFLKSDALCYDLGCSSGELTRKLADTNKSQKGLKFIGVDIEKSMINKAKENNNNLYKNINYIADDIHSLKLKPSELIVAYYTVMFAKEYQKQLLINKIYKSLRWGGAFILFEKVRAPDARFQDMMTRIYDDYKLSNGYLPDEIVAKTQSLKGILNPFSTQGNYDMLSRAGFVDIMTVQKYVSFEGIIAIK